MQDKVLLKVTIITDDDTGCYDVGELDFRVPLTTNDWLQSDPKNRTRLTEHLRWLAAACEEERPPFGVCGLQPKRRGECADSGS